MNRFDRIILILAAFCWLMVACSATKEPDSIISDPFNECIDPILKTYIPIGEFTPLLPTPIGIPSEQAPNKPWVFFKALPEILREGFEILAVSKSGADQVSWFSKVEDGNTMLYRMVETNIANPEPYVFEGRAELVIAGDGRPFVLLINLHNSTVELLEFDVSKKQFVNLPLNRNIQSVEILDLKLSVDDTLWWVNLANRQISGNGNLTEVYSINLESLQVNQVLLDEKHVVSIALDSKGTLFIASLKDRGTFIYKFQDGVKKLQGLQRTKFEGVEWLPTDIFISDDNQLFLNDVLWYPIAGNVDDYRMLVKQPIFFANGVSANWTYMIENPIPQEMTADGQMWYKSSRGLTRFDTKSGEWCMFTTAQSNIVKDSEGNLWLIYDNALYMLPAEETKTWKR